MTTEEAEVECPRCHGEGEFRCKPGCHSQRCDLCEGTGYVDPTNPNIQWELRMSQ